MTLRKDRTYAQWNPNDQLDITGHYGVRGNVAVFADETTDATTGTACPVSGAYTWKFAGKVLVMVVKHDDCTVGRIEQWTAHWTKISSSMLRIAPTLPPAQRNA